MNLNDLTDAEKSTGIESFITSSKGINGEIKAQPEYFYVEEVSELPELHEDGRFTIIKVRKSNWDTLNFARVLANKLRISQKRIEFAGTKDKKAVSVQYMSISNLGEKEIQMLKDLRIRDAEIEYIGKARRTIQLGDLLGNFFRITIKDVENNSINKTLDEIIEKGVPNYFGLQRFGSIRFVTHEVGKYILKSDFESAFWTYVAKPFEKENEEIRKIREDLWSTRDARTGLREFPDYLRYERNLLQRLVETESEEKAICSLPKNLKLMFTHAYQSYIFNRLLSERIKEFKSLKIVEKGDFADFIEFKNINGKTYFSFMESYSEVNDRNLERINFLISKRRGFLAFPIPGYRTELREGWAMEKIRNILERDEINLSDFKNKYKEFSSKGGFRVADMPYSSLEIIQSGDAIFSFFLPKGCYATSFLREFTKTTMA
jgi:tRNA pseudouridine13 synthase